MESFLSMGVLYYRERSAVQGAVLLAGGVVGGLEILGAVGGPGVGPVDLVAGDIVHSHRNPQHGGQGDQIRAHMAVDRHAMIGAPIGHDAVHILESTLAGEAGSKPGGGPGEIG